MLVLGSQNTQEQGNARKADIIMISDEKDTSSRTMQQAGASCKK